MNRSVAFDDLIITVYKVKNIKMWSKPMGVQVVDISARQGGTRFTRVGPLFTRVDPAHQGGTSVHQVGPGLEFLEKDKVM